MSSFGLIARIATDKALKEKSERAAEALRRALREAKAATQGRRYIPPGRLEIKALGINGGRGWI